MERDLTHDERMDVAYRVFRAMRAQYPDRLITLVDAQGRTLARSDWTRLPHIDAYGFYDIECRECGARLRGSSTRTTKRCCY